MSTQLVVRECDVCGRPVATRGDGNFLVAFRHPDCKLPEEPMTVKELHTFTDAEIETITDALRIADAHYRMLAETQSGNKDFCHILEAQARDAADLQLKIEAGR